MRRRFGAPCSPATKDSTDEEGRLAKGKRPSCDDCYFRKHMLCALDPPRPCTTFRPAERGLEPERQLTFVFRTPRTTSAYAFPPAR
jgi:hypothetical protein